MKSELSQRLGKIFLYCFKTDKLKKTELLKYLAIINKCEVFEDLPINLQKIFLLAENELSVKP